MKRIFFFCVIFYLFTAFKCDCDDCDDCGDLARVNYAVRNELEDEITLRFWGENNFDFQLNILEFDTSNIWSMSIDPTKNAWNIVLLEYVFENSFPGNVDSVYIFHESTLLKKWIREDDLLTQNLESIFLYGVYERVEKELRLFRIDSLKLGLN